MGRFTKKKEEEGGEPQYPVLKASHLKEITELYIKFGKDKNRVMQYWQAVALDADGNVSHIPEYTSWYNKSDHNKEQYQKFEPLKGIHYMGDGFVTLVPYNWCKEWMATWEAWLVGEAGRGDIQALSLMAKKDIHNKISCN